MTTDAPRRSWVEQIMGMPISILARGGAAVSPEAHAAVAAVAAVFAELRDVDEMFSTYRADSAVSLLARGEISFDACPTDIRDVAALWEQARELTGGLFDATRPDGAWDPSGYVKGWAVQRASRYLSAMALDWCLNAAATSQCVAAATARSTSASPIRATPAGSPVSWRWGRAQWRRAGKRSSRSCPLQRDRHRTGRGPGRDRWLAAPPGLSV